MFNVCRSLSAHRFSRFWSHHIRDFTLRLPEVSIGKVWTEINLGMHLLWVLGVELLIDLSGFLWISSCSAMLSQRGLNIRQVQITPNNLYNTTGPGPCKWITIFLQDIESVKPIRIQNYRRNPVGP